MIVEPVKSEREKPAKGVLLLQAYMHQHTTEQTLEKL